MGFTVPNEASASFAEQAELHEADLLILAASLNGYGVVSGCAVTAQGTPDGTVAVAAGSVLVAGVTVAVTGGNVTITADATNPRYTLIEVDSAGAKSANAGTPAANPAKPTPTATKTVLASVWVPANDTAIASNQIVDKRMIVALVAVGAERYERIGQLSGAAASYDFTSIPATYDSLVLEIMGRCDNAALQVVWARVNNDSGATYDNQAVSGANASPGASGNAGITSGLAAGVVAGSGNTADKPGIGRLVIPSYAGTTFQKVGLAEYSAFQSNVASGFYVALTASLWRSTAAINRLTVYPGAGSFIAGSVCTLWGVRGSV